MSTPSSPNSIAQYVQKVTSDPEYAAEIAKVLADIVTGGASLADLRTKMAVQPKDLALMSSGDPGTTAAAAGATPAFSTTFTTVTTATLTTPTTATTVTLTTITAEQPL